MNLGRSRTGRSDDGRLARHLLHSHAVVGAVLPGAVVQRPAAVGLLRRGVEHADVRQLDGQEADGVLDRLPAQRDGVV